MGFKRSVEDAHGVTHPEAYYRIVYIELDYRVSKCKYVVYIYHDQASRIASKTPIQLRAETVSDENFASIFSTIALNVDGSNPIKAAYNTYKTKLNDPNIIDVI